MLIVNMPQDRVFLGGEVVEERAAGDARLFADVLHGVAVQAAFGSQGTRDGGDRRPGRRPLALAEAALNNCTLESQSKFLHYFICECNFCDIVGGRHLACSCPAHRWQQVAPAGPGPEMGKHDRHRAYTRLRAPGPFGSMRPSLTTRGRVCGLHHGQKSVAGRCRLSLAQFDDTYERVYESVDIQDVPPLVLQPRGSTALHDAMVRLIGEAGAELAAMPEHERRGLCWWLS